MTFTTTLPSLPALLGTLSAFLLVAAAAAIGLPGVGWGVLRRWLRATPRGIGLGAGFVAGIGITLIGRAMGLHGLALVFAWLLALLAGLSLGVYLPGMEARQHIARRKRLVLQTIDFAGYLCDALSGPYGEVAILRDYVRRSRRSVRDLQQLISDVLAEHRRSGRGSILDVLQDAAQESGCAPLTDVAATLRHVLRHDRTQVLATLTEQRQQLMQTAIADAKRRAQRLELVLLGIAAGSLFFGLLTFILYVMTGGGQLLALF
jgi:hypothetical protein